MKTVVNGGKLYLTYYNEAKSIRCQHIIKVNEGSV